MSRFRQQLVDALEAVAVHPSWACSWHGRRVARLPVVGLPEAAARAYAVAALERVLYESFYCPGAAVPSPRQEVERERRQDPAFVDQLSDANAGGGSWESGWQLDGRRDGDLLVRRHRLRLRVKPWQATILGQNPEVGSPALLRLPKELRFASPGFYTAVSDAEWRAAAAPAMLRVYCHVTPLGAPGLMADITSALNGMGMAFRLKVIDAPVRFSRCDAAVLYVRAADFEHLRPVLRDLASLGPAWLRARTPAFTKRLARGIGLAEDPASGESFGGHRCRLLAEGIVEAHTRGVSSPGERLALVEAHFASQGIDLEAPYLRPGSLDRFEL